LVVWQFTANFLQQLRQKPTAIIGFEILNLRFEIEDFGYFAIQGKVFVNQLSTGGGEKSGRSIFALNFCSEAKYERSQIRVSNPLYSFSRRRPTLFV
jgi:hypothetical protein